MDRKVSRTSSYQKRMQIGMKFYKRLFSLFVATVIICAVALGYLWFWLDRYESHHVNGAMTRYMEKVGKKQWHEIYEENAKYFVEMNDEDTYTRYLIWLYGDRNVSGMTFSYAGGDANNMYYDVYYQQEKLCALELMKPEDSSTWHVRTVSQSNEYTFDILDHVDFSINGHTIDETYPHEEGKTPLAFESLDMKSRFPQVTRYTIEGFIDIPNVSTESDKDMVVKDASANHLYIGSKPTEEQSARFIQEIQDTAFAYCRYISKDGTFYDLNQHLYPNTDFYYAISGFNPQWFTDHDSIEFRNVQVYDVLPVGDSAFMGTITFDFAILASDTSRIESNTYQMFFVKNSEGNYKMTNMVIVSNTVQEE